MPIIKSAKKRVKVAEKQSIQNSKTKRSLRVSIKAFQATLAGKKDTTKAQSEAYSAIDTAVKKGVISKNKAARKKSQLNSAAKAAGTTKAGAKKSAKPASKTSTATKKKATVKKPAAKKAPAKK
jgi:small subunit ribosomal protein S20